MSTLQLAPLQDHVVGGKYRLGDVMGSGGVGTVYRAQHLWTEREVAIKVLDPSLPHFNQLREAFLREARATVLLDHPNVVDVLDMGEDAQGTTYMVMELLDGPTLRDVLLEQGSLSERDTASILLPLVDALERAHRLGIVHKDFKPENIILSVHGSDGMTPKLLDFGVAQLVRESQSQQWTSAHDVIVGTPQYMSPEQAQDERRLIGPQTDVWSVGVVWYECLTGRCPFDGDTPVDVLTAVCGAPIDFSGIPEHLDPVLRTALERSPTKRTRSLATIRASLAASVSKSAAPFFTEGGSERPPASERPSYVRRTLQGVGPFQAARSVQIDSELLTLPKAKHRRAILGGLALAAAIVLAAWWTVRSEDADAPEAGAPTVVVDEPGGEPAAAAPIERAISPPTPLEPPEARAEADAPTEAREPEPAPVSKAPSAPLPEPSPIEEEAAPEEVSTAASDSRNGPTRTPASSRRTYEKPPELVTEW